MAIGKNELLAEMHALRDRVVGVTDLAVATVDGLLMAADTDESIDAEVLAALTSATVGLARRTGEVLRRGPLHQTLSRFSDGYVVTQAVGDLGLMAVMGDVGMDITRLRVESQLTADRIGRLLAAQQSSTQR